MSLIFSAPMSKLASCPTIPALLQHEGAAFHQLRFRGRGTPRINQWGEAKIKIPTPAA